MKFQIPTTIYQEKDCVKNHAKELAAFGSHAFIITGRHSSKKNGSLDDVCAALSAEGVAYTVFDEIEENPSVETCRKAAEIGMKEGAKFLIGIGGGSPMDASKAIALLMGSKTLDTSIFYANAKAAGKPLPVVEVSTTAGTGSEVTPYAILTLHDAHTKQSISHRIYPAIALCDPKYLTFSSPRILKNTAVDALAHLVESTLNTNTTLYSRLCTEYGLKLWGQIKDDLAKDALTEEDYALLMQIATVAGMAITHTGTSIPHGLSYPVTYEQHLAHGAACGLFLPGYLDFCAKQEKAHAAAKCSTITDHDTEDIYRLLGVADLQELTAILHSLLGDMEVAEELWKKDVEMISVNEAKLKNCPYAITRGDLEGFLEKYK